jgi:hypothetical protein
VPVAVSGSARRLLALPDPARMLTTPSNCGGWPEPRVYLEGQVSARRERVGGGGGMSSGCIPQNTQVHNNTPQPI